MRTLLLLSVPFLTVLLPRMEADTQATPCTTGTLLSYENNGSCELGGANGGILVFSNFTFSSSGSGSQTIILNPSQITVNPDSIGLGGGFTFGGFTAGPVLAGQTATYEIQYSYFIDAGPVSSGADMGMDPPFGNVSITESICADSVFVSDTRTLACEIPLDPFAPQTFSIDDTNPPTSWTNHLNLNPIVTSFASIDDTISLVGGTSGAGFDSLTATSTVVNPTPEPLTLLTTLGGLLAIGLLRRSKCG